MSTKPLPKREIAISFATSPMYIFTLTQDATNWISDHAGEFGKLYEPNEIDKSFTHFVSPLWNVEEVKAYLETMGVDKKTTEEMME